jgi:hypothetical protein
VIAFLWQATIDKSQPSAAMPRPEESRFEVDRPRRSHKYALAASSQQFFDTPGVTSYGKDVMAMREKFARSQCLVGSFWGSE